MHVAGDDGRADRPGDHIHNEGVYRGIDDQLGRRRGHECLDDGNPEEAAVTECAGERQNPTEDALTAFLIHKKKGNAEHHGVDGEADRGKYPDVPQFFDGKRYVEGIDIKAGLTEIEQDLRASRNTGFGNHAPSAQKIARDCRRQYHGDDGKCNEKNGHKTSFLGSDGSANEESAAKISEKRTRCYTEERLYQKPVSPRSA